MSMLIKGLVDEDFVNYKKPSMFICCSSCSFKCDKENGEQVCQNSKLAHAPADDIDITDLIERYRKNTITKAIVFGGLEPFDDILNVLALVHLLRKKLRCNDDVVIYTGYTEDEIRDFFPNCLKTIANYGNVIIKFGRFIPGQKKHFDDVLGVYLSSDNQYAKRL